MDLQKMLPLGILLVLPFITNAQRLWNGDYTRFGVRAGVNHFNINTDDLPFEGRMSWTAGFTSRSSYKDDFQFIYGINFFDFKADITGREKIDHSTPQESIEFNMIGVQANFLGSYKILDHFLSVEAGPILQLNGRFEPRENQELHYIQGYDLLQARHLQKVSALNVSAAIGISGGFENVKFWAQYQHGLNNFLNGLNNEDLGAIDSAATDFQGHLQIMTAGVILFL